MKRSYTSYSILLITFLCIFILSGCLDILAPDLQEEEVIVLGPKEDFISNQQSVTFWWEEIELEDISYELEVVKPNFSDAEELVFKEIIDDTKVTKTLLPGIYQWRINAILNNDEISSEIFNLEISTDSTSDLSNQVITLVDPAADLITNKTTLDFLWQDLVNVENYYIQVATPDFSNSTFLVADSRTENDFLVLDNLMEGKYRWRVRGENENSLTPFSTQDFEIDLTAPAIPTLLLPIYNDTITLPATLTWDAPEDADSDSLFIFQDSLLQSPVLLTNSTTQSYNLQSLPPDKLYFWQVKSIDEAGNVGMPSLIGQFFVED